MTDGRDERVEHDSAGVYLGISPEAFGVRVAPAREDGDASRAPRDDGSVEDAASAGRTVDGEDPAE